MSLCPRYDEPFYWQGPNWNPRPNLSLGDLLRDGTIDAWQGAIMWAALARRHSLTIIGGPSGVGKTTLLTALTCFLPRQTRRLYLRGCFETFSFLHDQSVYPQRTVLLVNEISPHLPIYLWGPAVTRTLDAVATGFSLLATAHGGSVPEFVSTLTGSPLHIPPPKVAELEHVVLMERTELSESGRKVGGIWRLRPTRTGLTMESLGDHPRDISQDFSPHTHHPHANPFPTLELQRRHQTLLALRDGAIDQRCFSDEWISTPEVVEGREPSPRALSDPQERV